VAKLSKKKIDHLAHEVRKGALIAQFEDDYDHWSFGYLDAIQEIYGREEAVAVHDRSKELVDAIPEDDDEEAAREIAAELEDRLNQMAKEFHESTGQDLTVVKILTDKPKKQEKQKRGTSSLAELNKRANAKHD
jgi:signal transduction histidine kinase